MTEKSDTQTARTKREVPQLRLTDDGLEMPEHLVGQTGEITIEMPEITMRPTYVGPGIHEFDEVVAFPPTDKDPINCPEGHLRIEGTLYEIVDERTISECPECGSDKVSSFYMPVRCYDCDDERGGTVVIEEEAEA